jgi:hypothetical protein
MKDPAMRVKVDIVWVEVEVVETRQEIMIIPAIFTRMIFQQEEIL